MDPVNLLLIGLVLVYVGIILIMDYSFRRRRERFQVNLDHTILIVQALRIRRIESVYLKLGPPYLEVDRIRRQFFNGDRDGRLWAQVEKFMREWSEVCQIVEKVRTIGGWEVNVWESLI